MVNCCKQPVIQECIDGVGIMRKVNSIVIIYALSSVTTPIGVSNWTRESWVIREDNNSHSSIIIILLSSPRSLGWKGLHVKIKISCAGKISDDKWDLLINLMFFTRGASWCNDPPLPPPPVSSETLISKSLPKFWLKNVEEIGMTCHIVTKINTRQQSPADQISPLLLPLHLHNSFNSQMQPSAELGFLLRLLFTPSLSPT